MRLLYGSSLADSCLMPTVAAHSRVLRMHNQQLQAARGGGHSRADLLLPPLAPPAPGAATSTMCQRP